MDRRSRAKQFMPFDALKGFREAVAEKERIIVPKRDLPEEKKRGVRLEVKTDSERKHNYCGIFPG